MTSIHQYANKFQHKIRLRMNTARITAASTKDNDTHSRERTLMLARCLTKDSMQDILFSRADQRIGGNPHLNAAAKNMRQSNTIIIGIKHENTCAVHNPTKRTQCARNSEIKHDCIRKSTHSPTALRSAPLSARQSMHDSRLRALAEKIGLDPSLQQQIFLAMKCH